MTAITDWLRKPPSILDDEDQAVLLAAADEIDRLRAGIEDAIGWTDSGGECGQRLYNLLHPEPFGNGRSTDA